MELLCGRKHPLFDKPGAKITLKEIEKAQHAQRGYVSQDQLPENERNFNVTARAHSIEGLAHLILSGKYLAFLPVHYAHQWIKQGEMKAIRSRDYRYSSQYEIIRRKSAPRTPAEIKFFDILTELQA